VGEGSDLASSGGLAQHAGMNTPPPVPFGDPTKVQSENKAAVRKGIFFGCGGCLLVIIAFVLFFSAIVGVVLYSMRSSEPVELTLGAAQASTEMQAAIGEPMTVGWFITGSVNYSGGICEASLQVPISGPMGSASVRTLGSKKVGGTWDFSEMTATIEGTGKTVDLRRK
jgi:hypothetical protein